MEGGARPPCGRSRPAGSPSCRPTESNEACWNGWQDIATTRPLRERPTPFRLMAWASRRSPDAADPGVEAILHLAQAPHQALEHPHRHPRVVQHRHLAEEIAPLQPVEAPADIHLGGT